MKYKKTPSFRGYSSALKAWSTCFVVLFGSASLAAPTQWMVADGGNDHFYDVIEISGTWDEARADAETQIHQGRRGHLVTITSAAEQEFINAISPEGAPGWMGAADSGVEGEWFWVTGQEAGTKFWTGGEGGTATPPFNYANWLMFEPNDANGGAEDCAFNTIANPPSSAIGWNDVPCDANPFRYYIEYSEILIDIDIKPGSDPNCFNINGHGVIPVAVLGSDSLNVLDIDTSTLFFAGLEVRMRGKKGPMCHGEDFNGDEFLDLVCQFEDDTSMWTPDSSSEATLAGLLFDGTEFEGTDSICVTQEVEELCPDGSLPPCQ